MRLVLDTNVAIAALLWSGPPHRLVEKAIDEAVSLFSSPALIDELAHTLTYRKFARRMALFETTPSALVARYSALVSIVTPRHVATVIVADPDDDQVLACAVTAQAHLIVSGDKHLHSLGGQYKGIQILRPAEALRVVVAM